MTIPAAEPLPEAVATELTRLVRRWRQLPLDQAGSSEARVAAQITALARLAHPDHRVPDLGPAVVMDQLRVVTYDALAADACTTAELLEVLVALRRGLDDG